MENNYGMLLIWLFPLIAGVIGFYLGKKSHENRNDWIDIVFFVEWIMLACMGYQIAKEWSTLTMSLPTLFGMGLSFEMNVVRLILAFFVTFVFTVVSCFMKVSMREEKGSNRFYLLYMSVYSMLMGAVLTPSVFNLVLFVIAALFLLYPMIIHRQDKAVVKNASVYLVFVCVSMVLFMVALVILLGHVGAIEFSVMYMAVTVNGITKVGICAAILFLAVFAIFAGAFPVQFLITKGACNGLMEATVLLCSVVSKLGIYGMMMIVCTMLEMNTIVAKSLLSIAIIGTAWGLVIAFTATDIRRILMGINVAINGFNVIGISLIPLAGAMNRYALHGSFCMMLSSALSLLVMYMVALELVRKRRTFEIKGLIAAGKDKKLLMCACFVACASLLGFPGTLGYVGFSMIFHNVFHDLAWKWLIVTFVLLWAVFMTAVSRVFMKFFVSKKDETVLILSTEEEVRRSEEHAKPLDDEEEQDATAEQTQEDATIAKPKKPENRYRFGEGLLLLAGLLQLIVGIFPKVTLGKAEPFLDELFVNGNVLETVVYYDIPCVITFILAAVLAILLYVNLVHGVLLRTIRNRKNKKLKAQQEEKNS
ncbi:MAG: hypothetical protein E7264_05960 [Lachnospiraceae bacterium]|nr:hypothetical protein [Lachnospiraceae bacterium]